MSRTPSRADPRSDSRSDSRPVQNDLALTVAGVVGAGLVVASLVLLVFIRVGQMRAGYQVHDLRAERARLGQERATLDVERASLLRPARLAAWARDQAGLVPVDAARIIMGGSP